jgi:hypothetical protein
MSGFQTPSGEAIELKTPPVRIHSLPGAAPLPRAAVSAAGVTHRFGNPALNSRLSVPLPEGEWNLRWQSDLEPGMNPVALLSGWDRFLVWGWGGWQLIAPDGKPLESGTLGSNDVLFDGQEPHFFLVDSLERFIARGAGQGNLAFTLTAPSASSFQISFLARSQEHLIVSAGARPPMPHALVESQTSMIQTQRLSAAGAALERALTRKTRFSTAVSNGTVVIATTNHIYLAGVDLQIHGAIEGDFEPLAMSLDEAGRIYLIVRDNRGEAFWVVTPEGALVSFSRFPEGTRAGTYPPIVGYDHQVYVLASGRLFAFGPTGKRLWEQSVSLSAQGAITADDRLLLATGATLVRVAPDGQRHTLYRFDEALRAPAILTSEGELIAVTGNRIYCLSTKTVAH